MIGQGGDHLRGHQRGRSGLVRQMPQTGLERFGGGALDRQTDADAAVEGQELVGPQALDEPGVAGQDDGQQDVGIELGGGEQAQFGKDSRGHLLGLVDDEHRPGKGAVDMRLPALAQDLGAAPAVVGAQLDAEEVAHLAVEVGDVGLRPADHADHDVAFGRQLLGQDAQTGGLAGSRFACDDGKSAFGDQMADAAAEGVDARGDMQRLGRHAGSERVPFEAVEGEQRLVHGSAPSSLTR